MKGWYKMIKGEQMYEGKAKKVFAVADDPTLCIVDYKDDATAFNGLKKGTIVGKGVVNNRMSNMYQALEIVREKLVATVRKLSEFAGRYADLPTLAFTHFQPAQPTTVGKRATLWMQDLLMDLEDTEYLLSGAKLLGSKGTTGTQASFLELFDGDHAKARKLDDLIAQKMGFSACYPVSGQTYSRKLDSRILAVLSGIAQSAAKFSNDIRLLQHLKEVEEPFEKNQIGSSAMVHRAIGKNLTCIFVDHGLLRKNEGDEVESVFRRQFDMNLIRVNAQDRFLNKLAGVSEPEHKRKIIGEEFIRVFEEESQKLGRMEYLCQGTIYPDVIESGAGDAAVIKSHHNVGGLPDDVDFREIIEPLRDLFKDEVRQCGIELGIPEKLVWRQPFPGPGLAIRVMGEITTEKLDILKDADVIFREEIAQAGLDRSINQYFAVLTGIRSVGVMGDGRTYDYTVALRGVTTTDFMTADWARIPYDVLEKVSSRIVNEVKSVNRVVYDITSKPPATIEWE